MMGGTLFLVQSVVGEGSTFRLELPLVEAALPVPSSPPAAPSRSFPIEGHHVLVVDDDPVNRTVAEAQLTRLSCTTEVATNGAEAVARMDRDGPPIDLILMDQQMPEMDGLRATRLLRERGHRLPIVALTANAFAEDQRECMAAGMDAFLTKPITHQTLTATLSQVLSSATAPPSDTD